MRNSNFHIASPPDFVGAGLAPAQDITHPIDKTNASKSNFCKGTARHAPTIAIAGILFIVLFALAAMAQADSTKVDTVFVKDTVTVKVADDVDDDGNDAALIEAATTINHRYDDTKRIIYWALAIFGIVITLTIGYSINRGIEISRQLQLAKEAKEQSEKARQNAEADFKIYDDKFKEIEKSIKENVIIANVALDKIEKLENAIRDLYSQVEEATKEAKTKAEDAETSANISKAYGLYSRGTTLLKETKYNEAIDYFTKAIKDFGKDNPIAAEAYSNRGIAKRYKGDYDGAIADYNKAIELFTDNNDKARTCNNRGISKSEKGDYDGAIEDYTRAIELKPDFAAAYINRGNAKDDKGDYDGAIEDYTRAIELNPDYAKAYNNRGNAKNDKGDHDGAIADYNKAIELKPDYANAYNNRGIAKDELKDYDGAIADYSKAIELYTDDNDKVEVYGSRAGAYLKLAYKKGIKPGDHELHRKAKEDAQTAFDLSKGERDLYNLACAEARLLELEDAFKHLRKAIEKEKITKEHVCKDDDWAHIRNNADENISNEFKRIVGECTEEPEQPDNNNQPTENEE